MRLAHPHLSRALALLCLLVAAPAVRAQLVLSQVYGGGGLGGGVYDTCYVELCNTGSEPVDLSGMSLQHAGGTSSFWRKVLLAGTVEPGAYHLVSVGPVFDGGGVQLIPADTVGGGFSTIQDPHGKVALVNSTLTLSGADPSSTDIVDRVGYGNASTQEPPVAGALTAPRLGTSNALHRRLCGVGDSDVNAEDWFLGPPNPRNSASPGVGTLYVGGAAQPNLVRAGVPVRFVASAETCAGLAVGDALITIDLSSLGGDAAALLVDDGTQGDEVAGDGTHSLEVILPPDLAVGAHHLVATALSVAGTGQSLISIEFAAGAPDNDEAHYATPLVGPYSPPVVVSQNVSLAQIEWNAIDVAGFPFQPMQRRRGVWYTVEGTGTVLRASTCGSTGANTNTLLSVMTGRPEALTLVASNSFDGPVCPGGTASVEWCSALGETYLIWTAVASNSAADTNIELAIEDTLAGCADGPTAADCALVVPAGALRENEFALGLDRSGGCAAGAEQFHELAAPLDGLAIAGSIADHGGEPVQDWYRFTAAQSGGMEFFLSAAFRARLELVELGPGGSCEGSLSIATSAVVDGCQEQGFFAAVTAGSSYALAVRNEFPNFQRGGLAAGTASTQYVVRFVEGVAPANDGIAGAVELPNNLQGLVGTTVGAGQDVLSSCDGVGVDVWYRLSLGGDTDMSLSVEGLDMDPVVAIFNADATQELACNDDASPGGGGALLVSLVGDAAVQALLPAGEYLVRVSDKGSAGNFRIVRDSRVLADDITNPAQLVIGEVVSLDMGNTNPDFGLPPVEGPTTDFSFQDLFPFAEGVFFEITPEQDGTLTVDTFESEGFFKLLVFEELPLEFLGGSNLQPVTGNDNSNGTSLGNAKCKFQCKAGVRYFVYCCRDFPDPFFTRASCRTRFDSTPFNNKCTGAPSMLPATSGTTTGTTQGATPENFNLPTGGCTSPFGWYDTWHKYIASGTGTCNVRVCSPTTKYIYFYSASKCPPSSANPIQPLSCSFSTTNCNTSTSASISVLPGQEFFVRVVEADGGLDGSSYTLEWDGPGGALTLFEDSDEDGFGNPNVSIVSSAPVQGFVENDEDCNDEDPGINPAATELCDGVDQNCNGQVDEGATAEVFLDADGDTFGAGEPVIVECGGSVPVGFVGNNQDCDDSDAAISPLAVENCDGIDNNCNGEVDEGTQTFVHEDLDGDGFGTNLGQFIACGAPIPAGFAAVAGDCNDADPNVNPGAAELCDGVDNNCSGGIDEGATVPVFADLDGDGFGTGAPSFIDCGGSIPVGLSEVGGDCNDSNASIFPGATETCDGVDEDCDGAVDEGALRTVYEDLDGDGFGGGPVADVPCDEALTPGFTFVPGDCDDANAAAFPGAPELCDGVDNNCDGSVDEGAIAEVFVDLDGDGFGAGDPIVVECGSSIPAGLVGNNADCDDTNAAIHPNAVETCDGVDQNCNGQIDEGATKFLYVDEDGDGFGGMPVASAACDEVPEPGFTDVPGDCNDADAGIHPNAAELCDNIDQDCNGLIDDGATVLAFVDGDGDGFGAGAPQIVACTGSLPAGLADNDTDCNDGDATIFPGADESAFGCDGIDQDCDGSADNGVTRTVFVDADQDGFGGETEQQVPCNEPNPAGTTEVGGDCDDDDPGSFPGATELCDGVDQDCDGVVDNGAKVDVFADADGDGFGAGPGLEVDCGGSVPSGFVQNDLDCNDFDPTISPAASEVCDGVDQDCNGQIDDGATIDAFVDADGDGFGTGAPTPIACAAVGNGFSLIGGDCDDANAAIAPNAEEVCDGVDNDCSGFADDGLEIEVFLDADGDGFGDASLFIGCDEDLPPGASIQGGDCDDSNVLVFPGGFEFCDGLDNDCDGSTDEDLFVDLFVDADGDGFGAGEPTPFPCGDSVPSGLVENSADCDDTNPTAFPGGTETCDGVDQDCDGVVDNGALVQAFLDADQDGFGTGALVEVDCLELGAGFSLIAGDCDDSDATVSPSADEVCDGVDNDCDGQADNGLEKTVFVDADGDGFGSSPFLIGCAEDVPEGASEVDGDCDDFNTAVFPGAVELCDGLDNDCDGQTDEELFVEFFHDVDGDGFGAGQPELFPCGSSVPSGLVENADDCNDVDPLIFPGANEVPFGCDGVDQDCDGEVDEGVLRVVFFDEDGDGFGLLPAPGVPCGQPLPAGVVANNTDCDDGDPDSFPGGDEAFFGCDGVDQDCDGVADNGAKATLFPDADGDGFGAGIGVEFDCGGSVPNGFAINDLDCDDLVPTIFPGADELCDGIDQDCDGVIDNDVFVQAFVDADQDGFGTGAAVEVACLALGSGFSLADGDCDDANAAIAPSADEVCDGADNNCDGQVDEGLDKVVFVDADGDGFGSVPMFIGCAEEVPEGASELDGDCDDTNVSVFPGAIEVCDGLDNDCDGQTDEELFVEFFNDLDGDGFGAGEPALFPCGGSVPSELVENNGDCNDADASVFPGAQEFCDGADNDCNGVVDDGVFELALADLDGDGFGAGQFVAVNCDQLGQGFTTQGGDCDDADASVFPGAEEVCDGVDQDCDGAADNGLEVTVFTDADGDGFGSTPFQIGCSEEVPAGASALDGDCDDANASVFPGAVEVCDSLDNDCDGQVDEELFVELFNDLDGDGFGAGEPALFPCGGSVPSELVENNADCDDADASVFPGAVEICDGVDQDCDGQADNGAEVLAFADEDNDGFGAGEPSIVACTLLGAGFSQLSGDCNDADVSIFPGAPEVCDALDNDCDGVADNGLEVTVFVDEDGDGFGAAELVLGCADPVPANTSSFGGDCDDANVGVFPGAVELCDGIDNDCDQLVDNGAAPQIVFLDADGDGHGAGDPIEVACGDTVPANLVPSNDDCDDQNAAVSPSGSELGPGCDGLDNDCNGQVDDGVTFTLFQDSDGDGFGAGAAQTFECADDTTGFVEDGTDCDDANAAIHPAASEVCDAIDNNCNEQIDEGLQQETFIDIDGDGFGAGGAFLIECGDSLPEGFSFSADDCDDNNALVFPGASEACDGLDNDCDGEADEGATLDYFLDADGDGFGAGEALVVDCGGSVPSGHVLQDGDCDDSDPSVSPAGSELGQGCDGIDNNCDGQVDEGFVRPVFPDLDGDGFGSDPLAFFVGCNDPAPEGHSFSNTDCNDFDGTIFPGQAEVCDGLDNDCNDLIDDGATLTVFADVDGDGFGAGESFSIACSDPLPAGLATVGGDCDDQNAAVNPSASEFGPGCDGIDNDCNGLIDDGVGKLLFVDVDGDGFGTGSPSQFACDADEQGFATVGGDCNDLDAEVNPDAQEICDGKDNDCSGFIDDGLDLILFVDEDGDGFGAGEPFFLPCNDEVPAGASLLDGDCDDTKAGVFPGADEQAAGCDGLDTDCDGQVDEDVLVLAYPDVDGDGFGVEAAGVPPLELACGEPLPAGFAFELGDCDDANPSVNPGAAELCGDGIDQNCNGLDGDGCPGADLCEEAQPLLAGVTEGSTALAGTTAGALAQCAPLNQEVWHTYTNAEACAQTVTLSLCAEDGGSAAFDASLAVFEDDCEFLELVACAADGCEGAPKLSFYAEPGASYLIAVGVASGPGGDYAFVLESAQGGVKRLGESCPDPSIELDVQPFSLGGVSTFQLSGAPVGLPGAIYLGLPLEMPLPLFGSCVVHVDPSGLPLVELTNFLTDAQGEFELQLAVPNDPVLLCAELAAQGVLAEVFGALVTNGVKMSVQP